VNYQYSYAAQSEEGFIAAVIYYLVCMILGCGMGIVLYVFRSLGVYGISRRRGLNRPWLAWIPVADQYLLGCVSDQYQYVVKGKDKSKRKWLLGLNLAMAVLTTAFVASLLGVIFQVVNYAMQGVQDERLMNEAVRGVLGALGWVIPLMGVAIASAVFRFMALYDLYTSCDPRNSVIYLVLSILFPVTEPFFIFFNRNRDEGMPPRRETTVEN